MGVGSVAVAVAVGAVFLLHAPGRAPSPRPRMEATTMWRRSPILGAGTPQSPGDGTGVTRSTVLLLSMPGGGAGGSSRSIAETSAVRGCAVAVGTDGLLATTAEAVHGASSFEALTASGTRLSARLVAENSTSGIALLQLSRPLPAARFVDDQQVRAGSDATELDMAPAGGAMPVWTQGTITAVGRPVSSEGTGGLADISVQDPGAPAVPGALLVDDQGDVMGLLDAQASDPANGQQVYLPAQLVVGVAEQLVRNGRVVHGWLGISGRDLATPGAEVVGVRSSGPAAGTLRPEDVIIELDGAPVRSMGELRSRLFVMAPGTRVQLTYVRAGSIRHATLVLASSP